MFVDLTERNTRPLETDRLLGLERHTDNSSNSSQSSWTLQSDVLNFVFDYGLLIILLIIVTAIYFDVFHFLWRACSG